MEKKWTELILLWWWYEWCRCTHFFYPQSSPIFVFPQSSPMIISIVLFVFLLCVHNCLSLQSSLILKLCLHSLVCYSFYVSTVFVWYSFCVS
jgi:hypothetical protein